MSESKTFLKNLQILRNRVKQRRKQELYDMMNEENNSIEDKIALIKMSFKELDGKKLSKSFQSIMKDQNQTKRNKSSKIRNKRKNLCININGFRPNLGNIKKINNEIIRTVKKTSGLDNFTFLFKSSLLFKNRFEISHKKIR